jgi:hypothetical protein
MRFSVRPVTPVHVLHHIRIPSFPSKAAARPHSLRKLNLASRSRCVVITIWYADHPEVTPAIDKRLLALTILLASIVSRRALAPVHVVH